MSLLREYIDKRLSVDQLLKEPLLLIKDYYRIRGTYLMVYAGAASKAIPGISITIEDYYIIYG